MYKSEAKGRCGIVARVVADSIANGVRIVTIEAEYHRFIHSELMTHRVFSRNAASSRAIPVGKVIEQVYNSPATPIHWGVNEKGMKASNEIDGKDKIIAMETWKESAEKAAITAKSMMDMGIHKQVVNRILEPYQMIKTVITATEWSNFFALRDHEDAQPEIRELAGVIDQAIDESEPQEIKSGEWHLPYVESGESGYYIIEEEILSPLDTSEALKVSASCCAQVSYRVLDQGLEKALSIYDDLVNSKPVHASPFEHQATPMVFNGHGECCNDGVTHLDVYGDEWSGNFKGWIQHRQLIPNNVVK